MQKFCCPPFFLRILFPTCLFCLIFFGVLLIYTHEVCALQSSCDGDEKTYQELFSDRKIPVNEYRQDCNKFEKVSDIGANRVRSVVSIKPENALLSRNKPPVRPPLFIYVGTKRELSKKINHKLLFNNSEDTLLGSDDIVVPLLSIKGTLHPGATQMGLSLMSLLHMPFFKSGRFGLRQR